MNSVRCGGHAWYSRVTEGLTTAEATVGEKGNKNATMLGFNTIGVLNN